MSPTLLIISNTQAMFDNFKEKLAKGNVKAIRVTEANWSNALRGRSNGRIIIFPEGIYNWKSFNVDQLLVTAKSRNMSIFSLTKTKFQKLLNAKVLDDGSMED